LSVLIEEVYLFGIHKERALSMYQYKGLTSSYCMHKVSIIVNCCSERHIGEYQYSAIGTT